MKEPTTRLCPHKSRDENWQPWFYFLVDEFKRLKKIKKKSRNSSNEIVLDWRHLSFRNVCSNVSFTCQVESRFVSDEKREREEKKRKKRPRFLMSVGYRP